jgi:hypothetical protein
MITVFPDNLQFIPLIFHETEKDWLLINPATCSDFIGRIGISEDKKNIILTNNLITRVLRITPNVSTIMLFNHITGEHLLRSVKPEARVTLNKEEYNIGGLIGQIEHAYLSLDLIDTFQDDPNSFHLSNIKINDINPRLEWKIKRFATNNKWPPAGKELTLEFTKKELSNITIQLHYEIYDNIPLISKWLTVKNDSANPIVLNKYVSEILALIEVEPTIEESEIEFLKPKIYFESDYAFGSFTPKIATKTNYWVDDPEFTSQINYLLKSKCIYESRPPIGPNIEILPSQEFESHRNYELFYDSIERERRALAIRKMYRIIAPWVTENPIFMHLVNCNPIYIKQAIDQCVEVGFEMVIISFGSGMDMEFDDPEYYEEFKEVFDYAHQKGIEIGSYSLFSSRTINPDTDVVDPKTQLPSKTAIFGHAPCMCSDWGVEYIKKLKRFINELSSDIIEHDGPYPGDLCASTKHVGHKSIEDSQWHQWKAQCELYKWCRAHGVYINAPDWYYLSGTNKNAVGYREVNWSLPRDRQIMLGRQNLYDGTWEKTPSMGWTFTPLTVYHMYGDNYKESTLEPLSEHLKEYEMHLVQNFGAGVQSCYRGLRLYDTDTTKQIVKKWVDFYKQHREILNSDIIHVKRPNNIDYDCILHVNHLLSERGLAFVFNPLNKPMKYNVKLPLYYTGLTKNAWISKNGENSVLYPLGNDCVARIEVNVPAKGFAWVLIKNQK